MDTPPSNPNDHDLLIRLDTKVGGVLEEIRLLRDGSDKRIEQLADKKLDRSEFITYKEDHEKDGNKILANIDAAIGVLSKKQDDFDGRLNKVVVLMAAIGGGIAVLQFITPLLLKAFHLT